MKRHRYIIVLTAFILLLLVNSMLTLHEQTPTEFSNLKLDQNTSCNKHKCGNTFPKGTGTLNTNYFCDPHIDFNEWLSNSPLNTNYKLIQSHILTRHGSRVQSLNNICWTQPIIQPFYCKYKVLNELINPYSNLFEITPLNTSNILPGNCLIGQLNEYGHKQCFNHGNQLRKRYVNYYKIIPQLLNSETYNNIKNNIILRGDNQDNGRVLQSVMGIFQGLYPNTSNEYIIAIQTCDPYYDIILPNENICPILTEMRNNIIKTNKYQKRYQSVTENLIELTNSFTYIQNLREDETQDCGIVYGCYNYSVPLQFSQQLFDNITIDRSWYQNYYNMFPNYINATKFQNGPLLKLIYERLNNAINNQNEPKLYIYGGHDTGPIAPILGAFQQNITYWIPYASIISIEMFLNIKEESYYILLSYNGNILDVSNWCDSDKNEYKLCSWLKYDQWMKLVTPTQQDCPNMTN